MMVILKALLRTLQKSSGGLSQTLVLQGHKWKYPCVVTLRNITGFYIWAGSFWQHPLQLAVVWRPDWWFGRNGQGWDKRGGPSVPVSHVWWPVQPHTRPTAPQRTEQMMVTPLQDSSLLSLPYCRGSCWGCERKAESFFTIVKFLYYVYYSKVSLLWNLNHNCVEDGRSISCVENQLQLAREIKLYLNQFLIFISTC